MSLSQELSLFCDSAVSIARSYISHQKRGRNLQFSNALWQIVIEFLVKNMVILGFGGNYLYVSRQAPKPYVLEQNVTPMTPFQIEICI